MNHSITILTALCIAIPAALAVPGAMAEQQKMTPEQAMLQRIYQLRMAHENERLREESEARANVRLVTQSGQPQYDSPTVSGMRQQTGVQLAQFEQRFRCLDVDVNPTGGNTVVICGNNSGDISGANTSAGRDIVTDIVTVEGGQP